VRKDEPQRTQRKAKDLHRGHRGKAEKNLRKTKAFAALILVYLCLSAFICGAFAVDFATVRARIAS
jgi:hypothetical protein